MAQKLDRRQRLRQTTIEEIKDTARRQIAEDGAANLSLGAIARAMGLTTPALYRYFENRDALVMALIVDAYDSMAGTLAAAVDAHPPDDHPDRFLVLMETYRRWALAHRQEYALMFSASVYGPPSHGAPSHGAPPDAAPSHGAPASGAPPSLDPISRSVGRSLQVMVNVFRAAHDAGCLAIPPVYHNPPPSVQFALRGLRIVLQDETVPAGILALSFTTWLQAHGLIWQEIHGVLPEGLFGTGELYRMEIQLLAERLALQPPQSTAGLIGGSVSGSRTGNQS